MKKTLKLITMLAIAVCVLAVSAAAVSIDYRFEPVAGQTDIYDFYVQTTTDFPVGTHTVKFTYDSEVFTPVRQDTNVTVTNVSGLNNKKIVVPVLHDYEGDGYGYDLSIINWDNTTKAVELVLTQVDTDIASILPYSTGMDVVTVRFKLTGKTIKQVTAADFNVTLGFLGNKTDASDTYGFGTGTSGEPNAGATNPVPHTVTYAPKNVTKIDIPAGSSVYLQDGTHTTFETAGQAEVDLDIDGYVVVNTGYTAQAIYTVKEGAISQADTNQNALLGSATTEIRQRTPSGMRFHATITEKSLEPAALNVAEYGFIVAVESSALGSTYHLDMDLVTEGKAAKGVAFNAADGINKVFSRNELEETVTFTAVAYGVPMTKAALQTPLAARAYAKTADGDLIYGKVTRSTVYDTAVAIKTAGGLAYTTNQDYIDEVIATVEGTTGPVDTSDNFIDISELYAD